MRLASVVFSLVLFTASAAAGQAPAADQEQTPPAEAPADPPSQAPPAEPSAEQTPPEPAPGDQPAEEPVDETDEQPPQAPADTPAETPTGQPADAPAEMPAAEPREAPAEQPAAQPEAEKQPDEKKPEEKKPDEKKPDGKKPERAASATPGGVGDRYQVHFNLGSQLSSPDFVARGGFPLYEETATFEYSGETGGGVLVDVGGSYRVWRRLHAGISYSRVGGDVGGPLTAQIPDLLVHDSPRPISGSVSDLNHVEHAVHFQAVWRHPVHDRIDVAVGLGPTLFNVSQGLVSELSVPEGPGGPSLAGVTTEDVSDTAIGFHAGVDGSYRLTPRLAVGAFLRYAGGTVDLPGRAGDVSLDVGGLQVGAGVRLRFR